MHPLEDGAAHRAEPTLRVRHRRADDGADRRARERVGDATPNGHRAGARSRADRDIGIIERRHQARRGRVIMLSIGVDGEHRACALCERRGRAGSERRAFAAIALEAHHGVGVRTSNSVGVIARTIVHHDDRRAR